MKLQIIYILILAYLFPNCLGTEIIHLHKNNTININKAIDEDIVSKVIYQLSMKITNKEPVYIYINSPGGDTKSGNNLISFIEYYNSQNNNLICIANYAASMAFAILQSCNKRYATPRGVLMQHQISIKNIDQININEINNYVEYLNQLNKEFIQFQSDKTGILYSELLEKTKTDWMLTSQSALKKKVIDKIVIVGCTRNYVAIKYVIKEYKPDYIVAKTYSYCPLVTQPLNVSYEFYPDKR
jgi:ATP-dependent Clp protease protease subunit